MLTADWLSGLKWHRAESAACSHLSKSWLSQQVFHWSKWESNKKGLIQLFCFLVYDLPASASGHVLAVWSVHAVSANILVARIVLTCRTWETLSLVWVTLRFRCARTSHKNHKNIKKLNKTGSNQMTNHWEWNRGIMKHEGPKWIPSGRTFGQILPRVGFADPCMNPIYPLIITWIVICFYFIVNFYLWFYFYVNFPEKCKNMTPMLTYIPGVSAAGLLPNSTNAEVG